MDEPIAQRLKVFQSLAEHPEWTEILQTALAQEENETERYNGMGLDYLGWEWWHCRASPPTLNRMVVEGLLDITFKSRSATHFKVRNPELVREALAALQTTQAVPEQEMPGDLFASVVGHENIKTILRYAIEAKERVGVLLQGPPASAKTLFLLELARLPNSYYCLAQTTSGPGLAHVLRVYEPLFLIIDELDRLDPNEVGILNSLLSTGWIVETKYGKAPPIQLNTKVFAAGINVQKLPADLLSRFIKLRFPAYIQAQFISICQSILPKEGCDQETAGLIAREMWGMRQEKSDIREAVQIARLAQGERSRVEEVIRTLKRMA